mmetsp:Transcript_4496/g.7405  ORF Transcript_4496/g.7405 Transcript_4496/m.7405 type:complete len:341 (-) Transcript_4496:205-1227(-)
MSSAEKSTRKGFKYVKGKRVDAAETISYDDLEDERSTRSSKRKSGSVLSEEPTSAKKGRRSSSATPSSAQKNTNQSSSPKRTLKSSSRSSSSSSRSATATVHVSKHRYPTAKFEASSLLQEKAKQSNQSHAQLLIDVIQEISLAEMNNINEYFSSDASKGISGRSHVLESLQRLASSLGPELKDGCPSETVFVPELTKSDKAQLSALRALKSQLEQYSNKLSMYEEDLSLLVADHDMWLGDAVVEEKVHEAVQSSPEDAGSSVTQAAEQYQQLLHSVGEQCTHIVNSSNQTKNIISQSKKTQEQLFETFNKARMTTASNARAPQDAKELLRTMPALYPPA